jgi:hypothetical protein
MASAKDKSTSTSIDDVIDTPEAPAAAALAVTDHGDNFSGEKIELTIHSDAGDAGRQAVFVGINGVGFNIPRDTPVAVPVEVVTQLENCMQTVYEGIEGGGTREREVKRFSTTVRQIRK